MEVAVSLARRWSVAVLISLAVFGGCWWGIDAGTSVGNAIALAIAVVPFTIAISLGGAWAERARPEDGQDDGNAIADQVSQINQSLAGRLATWYETFRILEARDPSAQKRQNLMTEISQQVLDASRRLAQYRSESQILGALAEIAYAADELANRRILLDGGRSFNALTDGCRNVLDTLDRVLKESWEGSEGSKPALTSKYRSPDEISSLFNMRTISGYRDWKQLREMAVANPASAILLTWKTVHILIYAQAYHEKVIVTEDWTTELPLIASRLGANEANHRASAVLEDLLDQRNMVERGKAVSTIDALEYIDAAETVLRDWLGGAADIEEYLRYTGSG